MLKIKDVLITSASDSFEPLEEWCATRSISLIRASQIETAPILNITIPTTDWIFFSSPRGANLYLKHYSIRARKIGAYSEGTAAELNKKGFECDFIGANHSAEIARAFAQQIGSEEKVLFPLSEISVRSIGKELNSAQKIELITYQTLHTPTRYTDLPSAILFTSPSNFESYISVNTISPKTVIIAIGKTTATAISSKKYCVDAVLEKPNSDALIDFFESL